MSQVVYTITKERASDPWVVTPAPYAEACCTEQEMLSIITPYREAVAALTGLTNKTVNEISDTVLEVTYVFDTDENRDNGVVYMTQETTGRKDLMTSKRLAANVNYTMTSVLS